MHLCNFQIQTWLHLTLIYSWVHCIVLTKLCTPLGLEDYSTVRDTARLTTVTDTLLNLINQTYHLSIKYIFSTVRNTARLTTVTDTLLNLINQTYHLSIKYIFKIPFTFGILLTIAPLSIVSINGTLKYTKTYPTMHINPLCNKSDKHWFNKSCLEKRNKYRTAKK
jgi:hypothetical protein